MRSIITLVKTSNYPYLMGKRGSVYITIQEAAQRANVTIYAIIGACEAGHMRLFQFSEVGKVQRWRAVDEAEFEHWSVNRRPPGRKPKRPGTEDGTGHSTSGSQSS